MDIPDIVEGRDDRLTLLFQKLMQKPPTASPAQSPASKSDCQPAAGPTNPNSGSTAPEEPKDPLGSDEPERASESSSDGFEVSDDFQLDDVSQPVPEIPIPEPEAAVADPPSAASTVSSPSASEVNRQMSSSSSPEPEQEEDSSPSSLKSLLTHRCDTQSALDKRLVVEHFH